MTNLISNETNPTTIIDGITHTHSVCSSVILVRTKIIVLKSICRMISQLPPQRINTMTIQIVYPIVPWLSTIVHIHSHSLIQTHREKTTNPFITLVSGISLEPRNVTLLLLYYNCIIFYDHQKWDYYRPQVIRVQVLTERYVVWVRHKQSFLVHKKSVSVCVCVCVVPNSIKYFRSFLLLLRYFLRVIYIRCDAITNHACTSIQIENPTKATESKSHF